MGAQVEDQQEYRHQSMYWSDLGPEVGFEAIGLTDSKELKSMGVFDKATEFDTPKQRELSELGDAEKSAEGETSKDYGKGVIFYLNKRDTVVGVVSWNLFGKMKKARKVIADQIELKSQDDLEELAKLFFPKKKAKKPVEEVVTEVKPEVLPEVIPEVVPEVVPEPVAVTSEPVQSEPKTPTESIPVATEK